MTEFDASSRRTFLIGLSTVSAAGLAGCPERIEDSIPFVNRAKGPAIDFPGGRPYPTTHGDRRRTGRVEAGGPTGDVAAGWHFVVEGAQFPRIADGRVYVPTESGVIALDGDTGERQWRYEGAQPYRISVRDGRVFFYTGRHVALDAETGEVVWTAPANAIQRRTTGSPLYADGLLFDVTSGGEVVAMNAATGRQTWVTETPADPGSEVPLSYAAGRLLLAGDDHILVVLDAESGEVTSRVAIPAEARGAPAIGDDLLYISTRDRDEEESTELAAVDPAAGETVWEWTRPQRDRPPVGPVSESPALADGLVLLTDEGSVVALEAKTGEVQWRAGPDTFGGVGATTNPVVAEGVAYVGGDERTVALDVETGERLWTLDVWAQWGEIAVADGVLVVCNNEGIYTIVRA